MWLFQKSDNNPAIWILKKKPPDRQHLWKHKDIRGLIVVLLISLMLCEKNGLLKTKKKLFSHCMQKLSDMSTGCPKKFEMRFNLLPTEDKLAMLISKVFKVKW